MRNEGGFTRNEGGFMRNEGGLVSNYAGAARQQVGGGDLLARAARARHGHAGGENIPALSASDWSVVRIYPRFLRPIGPS
eukprot:1180165-Prorocentrum_minimum.AAC.7